MNTFFTSDLHLGHKFVARTRGFSDVDKHDAHIAERWNEKVKKDDKVFVLGDMFWNARGMEQKLAGKITLVLGNHDTYRAQRYVDMGFKLKGCVEYKGHILSHIPVHENQFSRYLGNVHGHMHDRRVMLEDVIPDPRYINVCLEQTGLSPIHEDEIPWLEEVEVCEGCGCDTGCDCVKDYTDEMSRRDPA